MLRIFLFVAWREKYQKLNNRKWVVGTARKPVWMKNF
jgi:hypothetical protein